MGTDKTVEKSSGWSFQYENVVQRMVLIVLFPLEGIQKKPI